MARRRRLPDTRHEIDLHGLEELEPGRYIVRGSNWATLSAPLLGALDNVQVRLPHRYEVGEFLDDVDALRDDVDRLAARIMLLEKRDDRDQDS